jgi:hypothetical protein
MPSTAPTESLTKGRAMRFAYTEPSTRAERTKRRQQVAEYVHEAIGGSVASEQLTGRRCYVIVILPRPMTPAAACGYAADCPGFVRGSCKLLT